MSGFSSAAKGWRTLKKQSLDGMPPSLFFHVPDIDKFGMSELRILGVMSGRWDGHWSSLNLVDDTGADFKLCHEAFTSGSVMFDLEIKMFDGLTYARDKMNLSTDGLATPKRTWKPQHSSTWINRNVTGIRFKAYNSGRFPMPEFGPSFVHIEGKP